MSDSHQAFVNVDEMVSKPVLGSDGALAWQEFKAQNKKARNGGTVAPNLPMKRSDRLGTGLKSIEEERNLENEIRKQLGKALVGEGYTEFKRKHNDQEAAALKKKKRLIESRIRPDDVQYYVPSPSFTGWKKDYVFTTRDYGTGYYWDGMDSARESLGLSVRLLTIPSSVDESDSANVVSEKISAEDNYLRGGGMQHSTRKTKKKDKFSATSPSAGANNPLEQVSTAIARRSVAMMSAPITAGGAAVQQSERTTALSAEGWETAQDPTTGRSYFYHTVTKETRWDCPISAVDIARRGKKDERPLPAGWSLAKDTSGKEYYYHENGKTTWDRPWI